jgi:hypothetical protein
VESTRSELLPVGEWQATDMQAAIAQPTARFRVRIMMHDTAAGAAATVMAGTLPDSQRMY